MDITIVIPIYNRKELIKRTLTSILESTYRPINLILVDNGSTDGSMESCYEFKRLYESEKVSIEVAQEPRQGASYARNKGLELCKTEYVYFFDSDDIFDHDFLKDCSIAIEKKKTDILICRTNMIVGGKKKTRYQKKTFDCKYQILSSMLSTQSMVLKKDFLLKIGKWNENLLTWDDWELGIRVLLYHPSITWLTKKAYHTIFVHDKSITGKNFSERYKEELKAIDAVRVILTDERDIDKLVLRSYILYGYLQKEKNSEAIKACKKFIIDRFYNRCSTKGNLLASYIKFGGRGAWRIALLL